MPEDCKERYLERILRRATVLKSRRYRARRKADGRIVRVLRPVEWQMILELRARGAEVRGHAELAAATEPKRRIAAHFGLPPAAVVPYVKRHITRHAVAPCRAPDARY